MSQEKLDLNAPYVAIGPYIIQGHKFFGLPEDVGDEGQGFAAHWRGRMKFIARECGLVYDEARSGTQSGYGHGTETLTLANPDGTIVFQMKHINHCEGPGFRCSYDHGPWYKYGEYRGAAEPDPELMEALRIKRLLQEKFQF